MYKYKNVSQGEQILTTSGEVRPRRVAAGGEVISSQVIENPNFEYVGEVQNDSAGIVGTQAPDPAAVNDAQSVTQPNGGTE